MCRRTSYKFLQMEKSCLAMEIQCASYLLNLSILWFFPSDLKAKGKQEGKQDELEDLQTKSLGLHYIDLYRLFFFFFQIFAIAMLHPKIKPTTKKPTSGLMLLRQNLQHSRPWKVANWSPGFSVWPFLPWIQRDVFWVFFYVHRHLGKISILTNIFETGWAHQLVFVEEMMNSAVFAGEAF